MNDSFICFNSCINNLVYFILFFNNNNNNIFELTCSTNPMQHTQDHRRDIFCERFPININS